MKKDRVVDKWIISFRNQHIDGLFDGKAKKDYLLDMLFGVFKILRFCKKAYFEAQNYKDSAKVVDR